MKTLQVIPEVEARTATLASPYPYWITIFLGAFLLFSVQLVTGKYFLPWFGGTPAMWTTCMFFFQVLLLTGYGYAHGLASHLGARSQARLHVFLLFGSLLVFAGLATAWKSPILPSVGWRPLGSDHPVWHVILLLSVSAGLPYFVLSTTGPLLQSWFVRTHPGASPYRLYALSNLGSLLGLLSYPFLVEPWLPLRIQARVWSLGFVFYTVACAYCAWQVRHNSTADSVRQSNSEESLDVPSVLDRLIWVGLAAGASVMFLATTNQICQDVAVVPFLWVLPLSIYLLSFIISFDRAKWYSRTAFHATFFVAIFAACCLLNGWAANRIVLQISIYAAILFVSCMVCHGELVRLKPGPRHLTSFYLMVALGGAIGGVLVALVFPHIFSAFWEYQFGLWLCAVLLFVVLMRGRDSWLYSRRLALPGLALAAAMLPGVSSLPSHSEGLFGKFFPLLPLLAALYVLNRWGQRGYNPSRSRVVPLYSAAFLTMLAIVLWLSAQDEVRGAAWRARNFYGVLTVRELNAEYPEARAYSLHHGRIAHGFQFRANDRRTLATGYHGLASGVGRAWLEVQRSHPAEPLRIGVIGLGVGTLAAYARPDDYVRFYEINPDVITVANDERYFTYLKDCAGKLDVVLGDARLSMESEILRRDFQHFDLLAIDAFSGDAVPVHLLTQEAFEIYLRSLSREGVIVVNITNRALDFRPVLTRVAEHFALSYAHLHTDGDGDVTVRSDWVLVSRDPAFIDRVLSPQEKTAMNLASSSIGLPLWTDDYSNLFRVLRP